MSEIKDLKDVNVDEVVSAINWNEVIEDIDIKTLEKLTEQFWLDTRIPVSNDLDDWRVLTEDEKTLVDKVFGGLTLLDTIQSEVGVASIIPDAATPHEVAVLNNIQFMESIHAKSYSTIFTTLRTTSEIRDIFTWIKENPYLNYKNKKLTYWYRHGNSLQRKATSVLLESFLFYSGFYAPLYFLGTNRLTNVAEIIKLIIRDESVHGVYIGYKFQQEYKQLSEEEQVEIRDWVFDMLIDFYMNEMEYTKELYDPLGLTDDVMVFLEYNANKALANMGFPQTFDSTSKDVNPIIMNGLSSSSSTHDFFSQVGNSYFIGEVEAMQEDDYDFDFLSKDISIKEEDLNNTDKYVTYRDAEGIERYKLNPYYKEK